MFKIIALFIEYISQNSFSDWLTLDLKSTKATDWFHNFSRSPSPVVIFGHLLLFNTRIHVQNFTESYIAGFKCVTARCLLRPWCNEKIGPGRKLSVRRVHELHLCSIPRCSYFSVKIWGMWMNLVYLLKIFWIDLFVRLHRNESKTNDPTVISGCVRFNCIRRVECQGHRSIVDAQTCWGVIWHRVGFQSYVRTETYTTQSLLLDWLMRLDAHISQQMYGKFC